MPDILSAAFVWPYHCAASLLTDKAEDTERAADIKKNSNKYSYRIFNYDLHVKQMVKQMGFKNLYKLLGVAPTATEAKMVKAMRLLHSLNWYL